MYLFDQQENYTDWHKLSKVSKNVKGVFSLFW